MAKDPILDQLEALLSGTPSPSTSNRQSQPAPDYGGSSEPVGASAPGAPIPRINPRRAQPTAKAIDYGAESEPIGGPGRRPSPVAAPPPPEEGRPRIKPQQPGKAFLEAFRPPPQPGISSPTIMRPSSGLLGDIGMLTPMEQKRAQEDAIKSSTADAVEAAKRVDEATRAVPLAPPPPEGAVPLKPTVMETAVSDFQRATGRVMGYRDKGPTQTPLRNMIDNFASGFGTMPGQMAKGIGIAAGALPGASEKNTLTDIGDAAEALVRSAFPGDPARSEEFLTQLAQGGGSMAGFLIGNIVGRAAGTAVGMSGKTAGTISTMGTGALVQGVQGYEDAEKLGAPALKRYLSFFLNSALGTSEALPIDRFFHRLNAATNNRLAKALVNSGAQSFEEFLQEFGQQVGQDVVAKAAYDPDRKIDVTQALVQGGIGAILGGGMGLATGFGGSPETHVPPPRIAPPGTPPPAAAPPGTPPTATAPSAPAPGPGVPPAGSPPAAGVPQGAGETAAGVPPQARAILRAAGWTDADIDDMQPDEAKAEVEMALQQGVTAPPAPAGSKQAPPSAQQEPKTPVADQPSAEPVNDLTAQLKDLTDPQNPRGAVFFSKDTLDTMPGQAIDMLNKATRAGQRVIPNFDGNGGILIAKNDEIARLARNAKSRGVDMQQILGKLTGAGDGKTTADTAVVQQKDAEGNVTREGAVEPGEVPAAAAGMAEPGRTVDVTTPPEAIARREEEIAKTPAAPKDAFDEAFDEGQNQADYAAQSVPVKGEGTREAPIEVHAPEDLARVGDRDKTPATDAQLEPGNYQKDHLKLHGLDISIETRKGETRRSKDPNHPWEAVSPGAYGYIKRTKGADSTAKRKQQIDILLGDKPKSKRVFVIDQRHVEGEKAGKFDEHKVIGAVDSMEEARALYEAAYSDGRGGERIQDITETTYPDLKEWAKTRNTGKPFAKPAKAVGVRPKPSGGNRYPFLRFLAQHGGLRPDGLWKGMDLDKVFLPALGKLIRKTGLSPDQARELAQEAGYFGHIDPSRENPTTLDDLHTLVDDDWHERAKGGVRPVQEQTAETGEAPSEESDRDHAERAIMGVLEGDADQAWIEKAIEIMLAGEADPVAALEKADRELDHDTLEPPEISEVEAIPGWDAEPGNLPESGEHAGPTGAQEPESGQAAASVGGPQADAGQGHPQEEAGQSESAGAGQAEEPSATIQTDDGETLTVRLTKDGPWDFNDTYPDPDRSVIAALEKEGRETIFDSSENEVEAVASTLDDALQQLTITFLDLDGSHKAIAAIKAGKTKLRKPPHEEIARLEKSMAQDRQSIRDLMGAYQDAGFTRPQVAALVAKGRKLAEVERSQTDKGVETPRIPKEKRDLTARPDLGPSFGDPTNEAGERAILSSTKEGRRTTKEPLTGNWKWLLRNKYATEGKGGKLTITPAGEARLAEITKPTEEAGADNKPQTVLPGAEKIGEGEQAQRGADKPLKPKVAQKAADIGLFGDEKDQLDLVDMAKKPAAKKEETFEEHIAGLKAEQEALRSRVMAALEGGGMLVARKGDRSITIGRSPSEADKLQVTYFSKGEPTGHILTGADGRDFWRDISEIRSPEWTLEAKKPAAAKPALEPGQRVDANGNVTETILGVHTYVRNAPGDTFNFKSSTKQTMELDENGYPGRTEIIHAATREDYEAQLRAAQEATKPKPDAFDAAFDEGQDAADEAAKPASKPTASWVIREKKTGKVIMETFDQAKVDALNTKKYEAVPIGEYLASIGKERIALADLIAESKSVGVNDAGEALYENRRGRFRVRNDSPNAKPGGYADFGGDLAPVDTRTTGEVAVSAAKNIGGGANEALKGLATLFNSKGRPGAGLTFDEETYAAAKPMFKAAAQKFRAGAADIAELIRRMVVDLRQNYGLTREGLEEIRPYMKRFMADVESGKETLDDALGSRPNLEPDSGPTAPSDELGPTDVSAPGGRAGRGPRARGGTSGGGRRSRGGGRLPESHAPALGGDGNLEVPERQPELPPRADSPDGRERSGNDGEQGLPPDHVGEEEARNIAAKTANLAARRKAQSEAESIPVKPGKANVAETLPMLFPEQQAEVAATEDRFDKPDGHGMLITSGTGTGKTYSGLGVVKRFVKRGKGNILIVAPSQGILESWQRDAKNLGLDLAILESTGTPGKGVVLTTYANFGQNRTLADREWDLVVTDEAHKLTQGQEGNATLALKALRALTLHPRGIYDRAAMVFRKEYDAWMALQAKARPYKGNPPKELQDQIDKASAAYDAKADPAIEKWRAAPRPKALMMSATPFAYHFSLDYGEGYLFDYPKQAKQGGYNEPSARDAFYIENLGYRMRYGRLTKPDANVDTGIMERQTHEKLRKAGALVGRALEVDKDYDRKFVLVEDRVGQQIDQALNFLMEEDNGRFRPLLEKINKKFDYLARMRLLEAINAKNAVKYIKESHALGRKVVVFHHYNEGGGFNPFDLVLDPSEEVVTHSGSGTVRYKPAELYAEFKARNPYVDQLKFRDLGPPIETLKKAFPNALFYNGTVPQKQRSVARDRFNDDNDPEANLIVVQADAGEAGISLHDTTGKHQRVILELGLPIKPVSATQLEGRIYRVGQASNALFRYMTTGTNWERWTFAGKIAERAGTAENLGMGDQARAIKQTFIDSYGESDHYPPEADEGTGGKERDRALNQSLTEWEKAKTHYFAQQKNKKRRDHREGIDYFATPEPIGLKMVQLADLKPNERILEPSAGHGAIARYFPEDAHRTIVEPSSELASRASLNTAGARVVVDRFENLNIVNKYEAIVMNPPFGHAGATAIQHIAKAAKHLANGGRIVALIPRGATDDKFDKWMDSEDAKGLYLQAEILLPPVTFERAGTKISARIVVLEKQTDRESVDQLPQMTRREMDDVETIKELFDRLENVEIKPRVAPKTIEPGAAAPIDATGGKPAPAINATLKDHDLTHTKTGLPVFVAALETRVTGEEYQRLKALATKHGGYYSSFKGKGAVPGFLFKTAEARAKFRAEAPTAPTTDTAAAQPMVVGYHGSREKFEKFDSHFIGTGEGHQAYAYGHYFGGAEATGAEYRRALAGPPQHAAILVDGRNDYFDRPDLLTRMGAAELWARMSFRPRATEEQGAQSLLTIQEELERSIKNMQTAHAKGEPLLGLKGAATKADAIIWEKHDLAAMDASLGLLKAGRVTWRPEHKPGHLYEVNIDIADDEILDWDAPIGEQGGIVRAAVQGLVDRANEIAHRKNFWNQPAATHAKQFAGRDWSKESGEDFYRELGQYVAPWSPGLATSTGFGRAAQRSAKAASTTLAALGVKGVRYRDQISRDGRDNPTFNYVVFPQAEDKINIARRYMAAPVDETPAPPPGPVFYSAALRAIEASKSVKAQPEQWLATLRNTPGVKPEELEWLGIEEWLASRKGALTREQVADFVRANQIVVNDVTLAEPKEMSFSFGAREDDVPDDAYFKQDARDLYLDAAVEQIAEEEGIDKSEVETDDNSDAMERAENEARRRFENTSQTQKISVMVGDDEREFIASFDAMDATMSIYDPNHEETVYDGRPLDEPGIQRKIETYLEDVLGDAIGGEGTIKFDDANWQLPGGKNYKELLLQLPQTTPEGYQFLTNPNDGPNGRTRILNAEGVELGTWPSRTAALHSQRRYPENYTSGHYDEPNVVAHVRFNDRTDAAGKKTLFIEEFQSDWHKQGRKEGYAVREKQGRAFTLTRADGTYEGTYLTRQDAENRRRNLNGRQFTGEREPTNTADWTIEETPTVESRTGVPDAPFKTTWQELAFKRMVRYAVDNGYDQIAWTPGIEQIKRWEKPLRERVRKIEWQPLNHPLPASEYQGRVVVNVYGMTGEAYDFELNDRGVILSADGPSTGDTVGKTIEDLVGKAIATRIMGEERGSVEGEGLVIGGKGFTDLYDLQLTQFANKLGKKFGARVGHAHVGIPVSRHDAMYGDVKNGGFLAVPALPITDAMREGVKQGQPLFARAPGESRSPLARRLNWKVGRESREKIENDVQSIMSRIAGRRVRFELQDSITPGDWIDPAMWRAAAAAGTRIAPTIGGFYERRDGVAIIGLALRDPIYEPRTTAGHEAWHHVEAVFLTPEELRILADDLARGDDSRIRQYVAEEMQKAVNDPFIRAMPDSELSAWAFQRYRRLKEEGRPTGGIHIAIRRAFDRLMEMFRQVAKALRGEGITSVDDLFEEARSGRIAAREDAAYVQATAEADGFVPRAEIPDSAAALPARAPIITPPAGPPAITPAVTNIPTLALQARQQRRFDLLKRASDVGRIKIQDFFLAWRRLNEAITAYTGQALPQSINVYLHQALYKDAAAARVLDLERGPIRRLIDTMNSPGREISEDDLNEYLLARHAQERNAVIRQRDPLNDEGSGMSDADAQATLARIHADPRLRTFVDAAAVVDSILERTRNLLLRSGLISQEIYDNWTTMFQHYVPLRGFEADPVDDHPAVGRGLDVRGKEAKHMTGRHSRADSPLAYVLMQAEAAIVRAEKNKVNKVMLRMVRSYPDPNLWEVSKGRMVRDFDPRTGMVRERWQHPSADWQNKNLFGVKIGGKVTFVEIHNPALARAMRGDWNSGLKSGAIRAAMLVQRVQSALATRVNPDFMFTNPIRDIQTALVNVTGITPPGTRRRIVKDALTLKAVRGVWRALRNPNSPNNSRYAQYFDEYRHAGGKISYLALNDIPDQKKRIHRMLNQGALKDAYDGAAKVIGDFGDAIENGVRLSVYIKLREAGETREASAFIAKELTVNFSRHGEWGPYINAFYLFFNASAQGAIRTAQAVSKSRKVQAIMAGVMLAGVGMDILNSLLATPDDDDKENPYDAMPSWIKERNVILFYGPGKDDYFMWPMPYGFNVPYVMGQNLSSLIRGKTTPGAVVGALTSAMANAFNPLGSAATFLQFLAPSILDPAVQIAENKNWFGGPITPPKFDRRKPWSEISNRNTPEFFKIMARTLNKWTGGDVGRPGFIDWSPEWIEHYAEFVGSGLSRAIINTWKTGQSLVTGGELLPENVPIARRFYGQTSTMPAVRGQFYDVWNTVAQADYEIKKLKDAHQNDAARQAQQDHAGELRSFIPINNIKKQIDAIDDRRDAVKARKDMTDEARRTALDALDEDERKRIKRALEIYKHNTEGAQ